MKLSIGNPQSGLIVEFEVGPEDGKAQVKKMTREACEHLRAASQAWKDWSLANETDEERTLRLENEQHMELQRKLRQSEMTKMRAMLAAPAGEM